MDPILLFWFLFKIIVGIGGAIVLGIASLIGLAIICIVVLVILYGVLG